MQIWADDNDSINIYTWMVTSKDGEIVGSIKSNGEVYIKDSIQQDPQD